MRNFQNEIYFYEIIYEEVDGCNFQIDQFVGYGGWNFQFKEGGYIFYRVDVQLKVYINVYN